MTATVVWPMISERTFRGRAQSRKADAELDRLALRARLAVIGAGQLDTQALTDVYAGLLARARGDGHLANGAPKILLDLARTTVEVDPTDPDTKPLEDMTAEERIALFVRLDKALREEDGEEVEPRDGYQADHADATLRPRDRDLA